MEHLEWELELINILPGSLSVIFSNIFSSQLILSILSTNLYLFLWIMGGNATSTCAGGFSGGVAGKLITEAAISSAVQCAAAAGTQVIAGSIFGSAVQAATVLGFSTSTAVEATVLGVTSATIAGAALIIACIGVGALIGYYVYTRLRDEEGVVDQAISREPIDTNQALKSKNLPEFKIIDMTRQQFNDIKSLTQQSYKQCVKNVVCEHTMQVMRQPYKMKCCKKLKRVGEKCYIQADLNTRGRCLLCQSLADQSFMQFDDAKYNQILGLRQRLVKVYKQAKPQQRRMWKKLIDDQFGRGYTSKHLEKFEFS